jgi:subtilisin family serine protease
MKRRLTQRSLLLLLCSLAACGLLSGVAAQAAQWGISPDLQTVLDRTAADEHVPVVIVMAEQADVDALLPIVRSMDREQRRVFARNELVRLAESTQARILDRLETAQGKAEKIRSLWLGNGIAAQITPDLIAEFAAYPEVRTILWDPPIPWEEAQDLVGTGSPAAATGQRSILWHLYNVNAVEAWNMAEPGFRGEGVVIAVVDCGVDRTHPDLANHMWVNVDEIPDNGIDDDLNGYIDDTWGWDFMSGDNNPMPNSASESHGTICAGCAAGDGTAGNSTGVAPEALIMACKVNSWSQNIDGIQYAIDNGADVITMSRSEKWRFIPKPDYDWWRANTDGELLSGIFHANSIGNEGDNLYSDPIPFNIAAPGNCPSPWRHPEQVQAGVSGIVGCGAVAQSGALAYFSSFGPAAWEDFSAHWPEYPYSVRLEYQDYPWWGGLPGLLKPDVVAPGLNVTTTTYPGGGYTTTSGTSLSTPIVAGVMALVAQANPNLTPEQMSMVLQTTATDLGAPGKDTSYGAGQVDAVAAILAAQQIQSTGVVRGVENAAVSRLTLEQNQPNPFPRSTTLTFSVPVGGRVSLEIFDVSGRLVRTLEQGQRSAGRHTVNWDGRDNAGALVSSGVYLCRLSAAGEVVSRRMAMIR